jgi:carotenoid cleavage dioxygenase-like enzyme
MTFNKKGKSKLHIVSRTSSARRIVELDSHFNFHVANAFERANGDIVIGKPPVAQSVVVAVY